MDAQTQDTVLVSEKEQLSAPPGWTRKLVPASGKSITLRKYDVVFIAPDGQELKSKWHLTRYLKGHSEGPAISEFNWISGEEAPRRSTRFGTKEVSEDNRSTSRKKGKRDATEMEDDPEKAPSGKRAKKAGKPEVLNEKQVPEEVETDVTEKDEVMLEAIVSDNEPTVKAAPGDEVQENESTDAKLVGATVKKAVDEELEKAVDEGVLKADHFIEEQDIQAKDEGLETLVVEERTVVSSANIVGEHEEIQVTVIEETKLIFDNGENSEDKAAQETGGLVSPGKDLKVEEAAMETPVIDSVELLDQELAENEGVESVELLDQKLAENEGVESVEPAENEGDVSCKVTVVTSFVESLGPMIQQEGEPLEVLTRKEDLVEPSLQKEDQVEPLTQREDLVEPSMQKEDLVEPSMQREDLVELPMQKEDLVEPSMQKEDLEEPSMQEEDLEESLMQKEDLVELSMQNEGSVELLMKEAEQERPTHIQNSSQHIKDKSPSEFGSSPAPLGLANHQ